MASPKTSKRRSSRAANAASSGSPLVGTWAYRFSGYALAQVRPWWLAGLGKFEIDGKKANNLTGRHHSAITPLQGQDTKLVSAIWDLQGTIDVDNEGMGEANILFSKVSKDPNLGAEQLRGFFSVLMPDPDHLWLISSGAFWASEPPQDADALELVQLEAVRFQVK